MGDRDEFHGVAGFFKGLGKRLRLRIGNVLVVLAVGQKKWRCALLHGHRRTGLAPKVRISFTPHAEELLHEIGDTAGAQPVDREIGGRAESGDRLHVVESLALGETPSTKSVVELLDGIASSRHVLVVLESSDVVSRKSVRNLPSVHVLDYDQLNAYDVLVSDDMVFTRAADDACVSAKSPSSPSTG